MNRKPVPATQRIAENLRWCWASFSADYYNNADPLDLRIIPLGAFRKKKWDTVWTLHTTGTQVGTEGQAERAGPVDAERGAEALRGLDRPTDLSCEQQRPSAAVASSAQM